jgi:hypothetical protein
MKIGRLIVIGIATIIAVAAAIATIVYFKDEILEIYRTAEKIDQKTTRIFITAKYTASGYLGFHSYGAAMPRIVCLFALGAVLFYDGLILGLGGHRFFMTYSS